MQRTPTMRSQVREDHGNKDVTYRFKVLLPNGMSVGLQLQNPEHKMPLGDFIQMLKREHHLALRESSSRKRKREIDWNAGGLFIEDANNREIRDVVNFKNFKAHECHILKLHDGNVSERVITFENMWDLTPVTDLLRELPQEYTSETALADLIDNSLQAVWANDRRHKKLISVDVADNVISIFDTGPGMDGSDKNSIVKWGKMGASLHRSFKDQAIGGTPPYLTPFFGMFGYGGPIASMQLGRHALISSKTKDSRKVYTLHLDREALLSRSNSDSNWKTAGGMRDPLEEEMIRTPHGSFTKVEIYKPKSKLDIDQLRCKLKDIYFPYIQCDEESKAGKIWKTVTPVNFEVNGVDLAEIAGGEIATTNLHSSNGPDFVLQLHFFCKKNSMSQSPAVKEISTSSDPLSYFIYVDSKTDIKANARLKCVYFPVVKGKENIERILESLESEGCSTSEKFETYSRVSIRRLGRLLPDARWALLPFMEFKQKKGDRAHLLKRCCLRVKCFIETDAGFNPTPSKNDLAHHGPFTAALRNFGNQPLENENDIKIQISRDGKHLNLAQLKREYENWILQMHEQYDDEADCGEDQPVVVVSPINKKALHMSSEVARVHKSLKRKGIAWKRGQKIKLLKGACAGVHKNNVYATIEYFLLEGLEGDSGGQAQMFCRPLSNPDAKGCILSISDGDTSLDVGGSLPVPVSVIDTGMCVAVGSTEWDNQLEKQRQKSPSTIDLLDAEQCQELDINGALPVDAQAGKDPPEAIVAIVRPASYDSSCNSKTLDQKHIAKTNLQMSMKVKFSSDAEGLQRVHDISVSVAPKSLKGFQGLYIFPLKSKYPDLFQNAGIYTFSFHLDESDCKAIEKKVLIKEARKVEYKQIHSTFPKEKVSRPQDSSDSPNLQDESNGKSVEKKVLIKEARKVEYKQIQSTSPKENVLGSQYSSHSPKVEKLQVLVKRAKVEYNESQVPLSPGKVLPLQDYSSLQKGGNFQVSEMQVPKVEYEELSPFPLLLQDPSSLQQVENLQKKENDIKRIGLHIGDLEKQLVELNENKEILELEIAHLQACYQLSSSDYSSKKEELRNHIERMSHTAASTVSTLSRVPLQGPDNDFMGGMIGLVALLGRVRNFKLSRILSEYLGEDQMLAVVCKSFTAACALEKYHRSGEVDSRHALYAEAAKLERSIDSRFLVICLEDLRPYTGDFDGTDPQRKLFLPDPVLPSGDTPSGFLGYAVNLVDLDDEHLHTVTTEGHNLRQTLFYSLFGELHVYRTRKQMFNARACIKQAAVSLDGGILKQTGMVSLGYENPKICFPILVNVAEVLEEIAVNEEAKSEVVAAMEEIAKDREKVLTKLRKKLKKQQKLITKTGEEFQKKMSAVDYT
ncbi:hypothetical protein ACFX15_041359 [Malus domestica]